MEKLSRILVQKRVPLRQNQLQYGVRITCDLPCYIHETRGWKFICSVFCAEEIRQEETEEGLGTSYEFEGVRVTVINDKQICKATGCSKFFMGKQARIRVRRHIRNCHLSKSMGFFIMRIG